MISAVTRAKPYDKDNGQCWRATRRQVMSSYGCQVRYLWLANHIETPYLEGSFYLETGRGFLSPVAPSPLESQRLFPKLPQFFRFLPLRTSSGINSSSLATLPVSFVQPATFPLDMSRQYLQKKFIRQQHHRNRGYTN